MSAEKQVLDNATASNELPLGAVLTALLFSTSRPLSAEQLAEASGAELADVQGALGNLRSLYHEELFGFTLEEVSGGYQLRTSPRAATALQKLTPQRTKRLSRAALETLSVIAYKQPVQRAEIEAIRGVDALPTLRTLLDSKLIRMVGRKEAIGQPALYGTTEKFLERFGIAALEELPSVRELEEVLSDPGETEQGDPTAGAAAETTP
jgi:segregation and condensation protein B